MDQKEPNRVSMIVGSLFHYIPVALAFLMPVFFTSATSEFFEFNKLALLTVSTLLLLLAWTYRIIETKKIGITKSEVDFPLFLLLLTIVLSTVFAVNKTISIFGSQGRWFPSLFAASVIYAFYYLVSGNLQDKKFIKTSLMAFIGGVTLSSFVAILSYYRIYVASAAYFRVTNFNLAGSITTAVVLAALAVILALALMMYEDSMQKKALLLVSVVINYFLVVLISIVPGWVVLGVGLVGIVFFISYEKILENTVFITMAAGTLAAITLVVLLPTTRELITNAGYPKELILPVQESWIVASETVQDYPTLATGPSSFGINFPRYRPLSLNDGDLWNVRFDKPYNEVFNTLGTLGLVGLLVGFFLAQRMLKMVFVSLKTKDDDGLSKVLGIAVASMLSVYLFTYATVLNVFVLFLLFAYLVANLGIDKSEIAERFSIGLSSIAPVTTIGEEGAIKQEYLHFIFALPILAATFYAGYVYYKFFMGEYYIRQSVLAASRNEGARTFEYQTKAIDMNPRRPSYHNAYAQTNLALANSIASKENLSDQDRQTIQQLIAQAIRNARLSTEVLSPLSVDSWTTRASIYRAIIPIAQNASQWSIASYNTAIQLAPTDPRLRLDLGGIYYSRGDYLTAANFYRQAILLKQDYANAHFNFAQALIRLEDYGNARRALEITRTLVDEGSNDYRLVEEQLANLPQPGGQQENLPTVEELEDQATPEGEEPTPQEPLETVGEEETLEEAENLTPEALPQEEETPEEEGQQ